MGMHRFEVAPHLRVQPSPDDIKAGRDPNVRSFDASPNFTLVQSGVAPKESALRYELIHEDTRHRKFNVYVTSETNETGIWKGVLTSETADEWRRRMHGGRLG